MSQKRSPSASQPETGIGLQKIHLGSPAIAARLRCQRRLRPMTFWWVLSLFLCWGTAQAQERIVLEDGSELSVFVVRPAETATTPSPLVILMAGGSGNASLSRDTSIWLGAGFARRGWFVAVPVSPNNRAFRGRSNNARVEQLIDILQARTEVAAGKALLAGISNGGMSALEIARRDPQRYFGVVAVPALAGSASDNEALAGFPVYLRIGSEDQLGWADRYDETVDALTQAGVNLDAELLYGVPHMFRMDWTTLEPWLENIQSQ